MPRDEEGGAMSDDWLEEISRMAREDRPRPCDACGQGAYQRADLLEAYLPRVQATMDTPEGPLHLTPLTLCWVGPCCASMANRWQPGDPG